MTPKVGGQGGATPSIRDNLSINREEAFYDDIDNSKQQLMENKNQLLAGLSSLPKPTNDFEICLLYTSPSPRDATLSRMPSSA